MNYIHVEFLKNLNMDNLVPSSINWHFQIELFFLDDNGKVMVWIKQKHFNSPLVFTHKLVTLNSNQKLNITMFETQKLMTMGTDCKSHCLCMTCPRLAVHSTGNLGKMGHALTIRLQAARWPPLGYPIKLHTVSNDKKQRSVQCKQKVP